MQLRTLAVTTLLLLLLPASARAASIGTFEWTYDALFGTGSVYSVTNQSSDPFLDVFVDLYAPSESVAFYSMSLGVVEAGTGSQTIDDLSFLMVPFDIGSATVRLNYIGEALTATLLASSLAGDPTLLLQGATDILTEESPQPHPVPEPSTLLLLGSALTAAMIRRRRGITWGRLSSHSYPGSAPRD
jgi:hypothetical protein